jgi:hypothetical protein
MRPAIAASALCLGLFLLAALRATPETPAPPSAATPSAATPSAATPSAATPSAATPSAARVANDDAAKHAKRTACLKEAKIRKLVGADKTTFIKNCMDAPADAISASRVDQP